MAVAFDAKAASVTTQFAPASPVTNTMTIGALGTLIIGVFLSAGLTATIAVPIAMTWNGVTMTPVISKISSDGSSSIYVYALVSPTIGSNTCSCTFTPGSGTNPTVDLDCFSFSGTNIASVAACIPSGNILTDASTPGGTVYPASPFTVTTTSGDAIVALCDAEAASAVPSANIGTLINSDNVNSVNYASLYNLAAGTTTQGRFTTAGTVPFCGIAFDIVQSAGGGGVSYVLRPKKIAHM